MADLVIGFEQERTTRGTLNRLFLEHPELPDDLRKTGIEFLHLENHNIAEPDVLDGYMFFMLLFALRCADRMIVAGPVTEEAIRNVHLLQQYWQHWLPDTFSPFEIRPESIPSENDLARVKLRHNAHRGVVAAFSGGVDATFLALEHAPGSEKPGVQPVRHVAMVHGFDVAPEDADGFGRLAARVGPLLEDLGIIPQVVWTNARRVRGVQGWQQSFGTQLACVLHQFTGQFKTGLIASSEPYSAPSHAWGSAPEIDHLFSGALFNIVHDGAAFSRTDKIGRIAQHSIARESVKFCWEGQVADKNCGECEKCIRTRLAFAVAGDQSPPCFDSPFETSMIDRLKVRNLSQLAELELVHSTAVRSGHKHDWVDALGLKIHSIKEEFRLSSDL